MLESCTTQCKSFCSHLHAIRTVCCKIFLFLLNKRLFKSNQRSYLVYLYSCIVHIFYPLSVSSPLLILFPVILCFANTKTVPSEMGII